MAAGWELWGWQASGVVGRGERGGGTGEKGARWRPNYAIATISRRKT